MSKDEGKRIKSSTAINKEGLASWKRLCEKQQQKPKTKQTTKKEKKKKTPHCEGYLQRGPLPGGSDLREI